MSNDSQTKTPRGSRNLHADVRLRCGLCRFFEHEKMNPIGTGSYGACVRYPPSFATPNTDPVETARWPRVFSHFSWCGEFKPNNSITGGEAVP